jgi:hypothetical protein
VADPVTWLLIATAASGGIAAVGAIRQSQAEKQAADYRAAVARNNAIVSEENAKLELQRGVIEEQELRQNTAQLIGAQRAGYAGAGVEGATPLRVQTDTALLGEVDALTARNNATRRAYAARTQAQNFESEAAFETVGGRNARRAGDLNALGSLVSGASSTGSKWQSYKQSGAIK